MTNRDGELTQVRLKEVLDYNRKTGIFIWKVARSNIKAGDIAGYKTDDGYIRIRFDGKNYYAHRLAWLFVYGYLPKHDIDHKDRIKDHNWIENLREATESCNAINSKTRIDNTSGVRGVSYHESTQKWQAQISILGKQTNLGRHEKKIDAARARYKAEQKYRWTNILSTLSDAYLYILRYESEEELIEQCYKEINNIID